MTVGKLIKKHRIQNEYGQARLANAMGVTVSYYSAIEHGKKGVPPRVFDNLCESLHLTLAERLELLDLMAKESTQIRLNKQEDCADFPSIYKIVLLLSQSPAQSATAKKFKQQSLQDLLTTQLNEITPVNT